MGELSERIGEKLEDYASKMFEHMGGKILGKNIQIDCTHNKHKNGKGDDKNTHGIDVLVGYYNPFSDQKEAMIVECKHREWKTFTPSNLTLWVEELLNTIECASTSPVVTPFLSEYNVIAGGIVFYYSSDNQYDAERAVKSMSGTIVPRRRHPLMLYLADNNKVDQWLALTSTIDSIKTNSVDNKFDIIYPSVGGSEWKRLPILTPSYLFSDFILGAYTVKRESYEDIKKVDVKTIFCFESINEGTLAYLRDMINELQIEAHNERPQEVHFYFYPESEAAVDRIKALTSILTEKKKNYKVYIMNNRNLSRVNYPDIGGDL